MMGFVLGATTGYVLGARAGRERYEQIVAFCRQVAEHPSVQSAAGVAWAKANELVSGRTHEPEHAADRHP